RLRTATSQSPGADLAPFVVLSRQPQLSDRVTLRVVRSVVNFQCISRAENPEVAGCGAKIGNGLNPGDFYVEISSCDSAFRRKSSATGIQKSGNGKQRLPICQAGL